MSLASRAWINSSGSRPFSLQKLSAFHLLAWQEGLGEEPFNHLLTARNLYDSSLTILGGCCEATDPRLIDTLRERTIVDYYLASSPPPNKEDFSFHAGPSSGMNAMNDPAMYMINGFNSGRDALERVVQLRRQTPNVDPLDTGEAIAELGDWHLLFGRRQTALGLYHEALAAATTQTLPADRATQTLFGHPLELPVQPDSFAKAAPLPASEAYIQVAFTVDERGRASDMRVVEAVPAPSDSQVGKLRRRLYSTNFRPRYESAQPVVTTDVKFRYRYAP